MRCGSHWIHYSLVTSFHHPCMWTIRLGWMQPTVFSHLCVWGPRQITWFKDHILPVSVGENRQTRPPPQMHIHGDHMLNYVPPVLLYLYAIFWRSCRLFRYWAETQEPSHPSLSAAVISDHKCHSCDLWSHVSSCTSCRNCFIPSNSGGGTTGRNTTSTLHQCKRMYSPCCATHLPSVKICSSFHSRDVALNWLWKQI